MACLLLGPNLKHGDSNMNKVKVGFQPDPIPQKIQKTQVIIDKLTNNPAFPKAQALLPALQSGLDELGAAAQAAQSSQTTTKGLFVVQDEKERAVDAQTAALCGDVNAEAGGNEVELVSSGFELAKDTTLSVPAPGAATDFSLTRGDNPGTVDGHCHSVKGARAYESRFIVGAMPEGDWQNGATFFNSKFEWTGLTSGSKVWIEVRATGTAGAGPWSDAISIVVP